MATGGNNCSEYPVTPNAVVLERFVRLRADHLHGGHFIHGGLSCPTEWPSWISEGRKQRKQNTEHPDGHRACNDVYSWPLRQIDKYRTPATEMHFTLVKMALRL